MTPCSRWRRLIPSVALAALACSSSFVNPSPVIEPIQITSVEVLLMESFPVQGMAHVTGVIGDACATLHSEEVERTGSVVTVTILRERRVDVICAQVAKLYDRRIGLGTFPPGDYVLRVNDVERRFHVD